MSAQHQKRNPGLRKQPRELNGEQRKLASVIIINNKRKWIELKKKKNISRRRYRGEDVGEDGRMKTEECGREKL